MDGLAKVWGQQVGLYVFAPWPLSDGAKSAAGVTGATITRRRFY